MRALLPLTLDIFSDREIMAQALLFMSRREFQ
jgi:hypothetical protein